VANAPLGTYSAANIQGVTYIGITFGQIKNINAPVQYTQVLSGCMFDQSKPSAPCVPFGGNKVETFSNGAFKAIWHNQGSVFIPKPPDPNARFDINRLLDIKWCPDQKHFEVTVDDVGPYILAPLSAWYTVWRTVWCSFPWYQGWCNKPFQVYG
tara:strand:- start:691 stop:1152 length:462 start_codon:yes stop_codon:yes gene_type:complete